MEYVVEVSSSKDKTGQVHGRLTQLSSQITRLHQALGELEGRLDGVLSQEPVDTDDKVASGDPQVPLAADIYEQVRRITGMAEVVEALVGRLEL